MKTFKDLERTRKEPGKNMERTWRELGKNIERTQKNFRCKNFKRIFEEL